MKPSSIVVAANPGFEPGMIIMMQDGKVIGKIVNVKVNAIHLRAPGFWGWVGYWIFRIDRASLHAIQFINGIIELV